MKNFFSFQSSRSRMVALWFVDVLTIVANSYLALFLRVVDERRSYPIIYSREQRAK